jgi:pyrroline-5-carboxylate reductase
MSSPTAAKRARGESPAREATGSSARAANDSSGGAAASSGAVRVGFVGAGQMAYAMAAGFISSGRVRASDICASDPVPSMCARMEKELHASFVTSDSTLIPPRSDVVIIAVKPDKVGVVCSSFAEKSRVSADALKVYSSPLYISIAAGVTLSDIASSVSCPTRLPLLVWLPLAMSVVPMQVIQILV